MTNLEMECHITEAVRKAFDVFNDTNSQVDGGLPPTLSIAGIPPCSSEDIQRLTSGVRATLAQLRDMESLYTGEADLKKRSDAELHGMQSDARNASRKLAIVLGRLCDPSADDHAESYGPNSLLKVLTHDTVVHAFSDDKLNGTLSLKELVHFVFWRAVSAVKHATAVCEELGDHTKCTQKRPRPENIVDIEATEVLHSEALQLVPLLLQHVLRVSLGKCEQRAIDTFIRKDSSPNTDEQLVEEVQCSCPIHGTRYHCMLKVDSKALHTFATAHQIAARTFTDAANAYCTDTSMQFTCGCTPTIAPTICESICEYCEGNCHCVRAIDYNRALPLREAPLLEAPLLEAAFAKVADAEAAKKAERVRAQKQLLSSIVDYPAVETAHCQVEDLRDRLQHEIVMRKLGVDITMATYRPDARAD